MLQLSSQLCEERKKVLSEPLLLGLSAIGACTQGSLADGSTPSSLLRVLLTSGEHSIRCFLIYSPLAWPVIAHPDSSPAGRVEVYLSQKNRSGGYRALLGCGNSGVKPSEAEGTSQISCFLDEGTMASCTRWARVLSSSSELKEIQGIILLPWAQKSMWGSQAQFHKGGKSKQEKNIPDRSFFSAYYSLIWKFCHPE